LDVSVVRGKLTDRCVFHHQNLLEYPQLATEFDVIFMYLLPDLLKHHQHVNVWLWTAVAERRSVVVTMRWQLQDAVATPWSSLLTMTRTDGIEHAVYVYCLREE
jgi:hypothetical protein